MKDVHGGDIWSASFRAGVPPERIVDFSASINPLGLSPAAEAAVKASLGFACAYPDPGVKELTGALARYHGLPGDRILAGNGSTEFIYLIPQVFRPKSVLIVGPAFSEYEKTSAAFGCRVDHFLAKEDDSFVPDMDSLLDRLGNGYDLLYVSNPMCHSGVVLERGGLVRLIKECRKRSTVLIVDEAFCDFKEEASVKTEAAAGEGVVVLRSMTKFFAMAGLRLGYMISEKDTIEAFRRLRPAWSVNTLSAAAGTASLNDTDYIEATRRWFAEERAYMSGRLGELDMLKVFPGGANFFLLKLLSDDVRVAGLSHALLERGVLVRDLGSVKGLGEGFFRVALRGRKDNELLLRCLGETLRSFSGPETVGADQACACP